MHCRIHEYRSNMCGILNLVSRSSSIVLLCSTSLRVAGDSQVISEMICMRQIADSSAGAGAGDHRLHVSKKQIDP